MSSYYLANNTTNKEKLHGFSKATFYRPAFSYFTIRLIVKSQMSTHKERQLL
jgi:hypothetical protein